MKDAQGHGSNSRNGGSTGTSGRNTQAHVSFYDRAHAAALASQAAHGGGGDQSGNPVTSGGRGADWGDWQNKAAAGALASGPKSAPVAVHDSMSSYPHGSAAERDHAEKMALSRNSTGQGRGDDRGSHPVAVHGSAAERDHAFKMAQQRQGNYPGVKTPSDLRTE